MNYSQTIAYILKQLPMFQHVGKTAYREGLDNTLKLDTYFCHPHSHFKTIHVAGTNGKGSVSHMLASVLQEAGYKVGLYTSPHLIDFRERIKINGQMIPKKFVSGFIGEHKSFFEGFTPSFFEISVYLAFEYFRQEKVDIAVIEVGLGGRLDATNIISPVLSVITNIGMDHTDLLGDTLAKIAAEKAGIIKNNTPVVIGETQAETIPVFSRVAQKRNAPITMADAIYKIDYSLKSLDGYQVFNVAKHGEVHYVNLKCGLLGHYQRKNAATVLAAIEVLQQLAIHITEKDIFSGIRKVIVNTGLSGRWQITGHNPATICDTAHNADGIKTVMQQVNETPYRKLHLILGFVKDKNVTDIMKFLPPKASYYFTRLSVPRSLGENELAGLAKQCSINGKAFAGIEDAYSAAKSVAGEDDLIMITGSNFLVADFLNLLKKPGKAVTR
ncbi:MAG: bifunctional folylpolyglutamate synthase/dihydrofolate synthase [Bacteroidales bacterium]|nr:bifunctional folylpolyglutamate synthase/dihydrofolate synthase [Bacteroidales bacterium]